MDEGILNRAGRFFWKKRDPTGWDAMWRGLRLGANDGSVAWDDHKAHIKAYTIGTVFTCINKNATNFASVPLNLYAMKTSADQEFEVTQTRQIPGAEKRYLMALPGVKLRMKRARAVDIVEVMEHPSLDLLDHVNNRMTRHDLMERLIQFLELTGNCYWHLRLKTVDGEPQPTDIEFLPPSEMKPIPDGKGGVKQYEQRTGSKKKIYKPDEIIHFWYPGPFHEYVGCSPLVAAYRPAQIEEKGQIYNHNTFDNMGVPAAVLTSEKQLSDASWKRLEKQLKEKHGGYKRANKNLIIDGLGAKFDFKPLGFGPKEMGFIESGKMSRESIANIFGVPLSMLTLEHNNQATSRSQNAQYWRQTIQPKLVRVQEELTASLAHQFFGDGFFYAFENPVPEDVLLMANVRRMNLQQGYSNVNEERAENNREPVDGGDENLVPANMVPISSAGMAQQQPAEISEDMVVDLVEKAMAVAEANLRRNGIVITGEDCGH